MRRLVQHAVAGVGFSAVVAAAAVIGLGSNAENEVAIAVPAAVTTTAPQPVADSIDEDAAAQQKLDADRAARAELANRSAKRAATAAAKRAATLAKQGKSIKAQQAKIKAERAAAAAAAKKAEADRARAIANRGYLPGTTDPREMAKQILKNKFNYGPEQYDCFNYIIMRESMWDVNATNRSSGAYGIPQALPGTKMASVGADWRTNPATQIIWGIGYMKDRYGSPCQAKSFKASHGWY